MSPPPSKEALEKTLQRAANGDEAAWRRIVDAYGPRVFGLIRAQCGNVELAEEITQSAFCTIVARIGQYTELGRFESWLFRIAMNRLRDEMRRRKRQARPVEGEALVGLAGAGEPSPDRPREDEVRALRAAMERLSEADRRVIHLRHFAGLSFARIAEVLGEPLGTVLARQHRALGKLRQMLAEGKP
jgi:RNA polymerase sigma-70 factor (ECF subfamily)